MITIIAVGKLKKNEFRTLTEDYMKRISRFMRITLLEVADRDCDSDPAGAVEAEGEDILRKIPPRCYVVSCTPEGRSLDSVAFAEHLRQVFNSSVSDICFVIGGSAGLSDKVKKRSDMCLSFSSFTFAHNLFRVILTEQIYRAFKIINHEKYHK
ncbi:MAG: 23S rRNA (pseudouridine(1915)-N(3))-methyltransferase RlmH [Eubacteriaceae bacterium]|nr:23S rRNA (pseudouridine(1915)-N(3))-methyltransferase RlmH [Eubacteriaceae bacterium]